GEDAQAGYGGLGGVVSRLDEYLETGRRGRAVLGATPRSIPDAEVRRRCAELVLPVVRGMLGSQPEGRVILHFDDGEDILATLGAERLPGLVRRGMATPEHILRAGRLPVWLDLDPSAPAERLVDAVRTQLAQQRPACAAC